MHFSILLCAALHSWGDFLNAPQLLRLSWWPSYHQKWFPWWSPLGTSALLWWSSHNLFCYNTRLFSHIEWSTRHRNSLWTCRLKSGRVATTHIGWCLEERIDPVTFQTELVYLHNLTMIPTHKRQTFKTYTHFLTSKSRSHASRNWCICRRTRSQ